MLSDPIREAAPLLPLFVPANRLDRLPRAAASGADAVIIDLEDAVAETAKDEARAALVETLTGHQPQVPLLVRVNAVSTPHFAADLAAITALPIAGIVLPKTEPDVDLAGLRASLGAGRVIVGLVETARGIAAARDLAFRVERLAFGSIDYAAAIGMAHEREALLAARSELVLAAALAEAPAPLDGVTRRFDEPAPVQADARHAAALGCGGKLLIHPVQIAPAIQGFAPDVHEVDRAREILARANGNASQQGGAMIDRPVVEAAQRQVTASEDAERRLAAIAERARSRA